MYCTVPPGIAVLPGSWLYYKVFYCFSKYCNVLPGIVLHNQVLYWTTEYCTVLLVLYCTTRYCTVLPGILLYYMVLYGTTIYCSVLQGTVAERKHLSGKRGFVVVLVAPIFLYFCNSVTGYWTVQPGIVPHKQVLYYKVFDYINRYCFILTGILLYFKVLNWTTRYCTESWYCTAPPDTVLYCQFFFWAFLQGGVRF